MRWRSMRWPQPEKDHNFQSPGYHAPSKLPPNTNPGPIQMLDKNLASLKSAKIAKQLQKNPSEDLSRLLREIPADEESLELFARFCHVFEISLSAENVVPVACLAQKLEMTETHCSDNLLNKAVSFFEKHIMQSWSNSIKALKSADKGLFEQAEDMGLVNYCIETLILKAIDDPHLLGDPLVITEESNDEEDDEKFYKKKQNTRRKLFCSNDWKPQEDLTTLPLRLYAPVIHSMIKQQVPLQYVAANICKYAENWLFTQQELDHHHRKIIENLVMLLPHQTTGLIPTTFLSKMLCFAIAVEASPECRNRLEEKIGLQLAEASTKDLLIPCQGYANDDVYDTECVRRILKHFYNNYTSSDPNSLIVVADLMEELLVGMAADVELNTTTFIAMAEMSKAASEASAHESSNGIYRAVDVYLDKHRHLIESEKEELCKHLDFNKLSLEALQHAAMNERLPPRVVVQALFALQLKIRDEIPAAVHGGEEEAEEGEILRTEMERMGSKVSELERECLVMRKEIGKREKKKVSLWKEMKRKFGCMSSMHDCDSHVSKKMKKNPKLLNQSKVMKPMKLELEVDD